MKHLLLGTTLIIGIILSSCSSATTGSDGDTDKSTKKYNVSVTVSPADAGTISPSAEGTYKEGESITLQANPTDGYVFTSWSGDVESHSNPLDITVDRNYVLTANFVKKTYELAISTTGEGAVTETLIREKAKEYEHGTVVELTANPAQGYAFIEWQGDLTTTDNPAQILVDEPKGVTAVFEKKSYELTVNTSGEGAVSERVIQSKTKSYEYGTIVELTANPAEGWKFVEWQGALSSTENPAQITVDEAKEVTAIFEKESFKLTVNTSGEGSVSKIPSQAEYEFGTTVELTASTTGDWIFSYWEGDITGVNNSVTVTMDADKVITAVFFNTVFAGGNGTQTNPYQVSTIEQLQSVNDYLGAHFIQINDIDASVTANWNGGKGFRPIGDDVVRFNGSYDGQSYIIRNLIIYRETESYVGLFGYISDTSIVRRVKLVDVDITGKNYVGAIVGKLQGRLIFSSVEGNSIIKGTGGYTGGIIGLASAGSSIKYSYSKADVLGDWTVGGLIGRNHASILESYFSGNITGTGNNIGGLAGFNGGKITLSYASGSVSGGNKVGGLIGLNNSNFEVTQIYSTASVTGDSEVGGLVGVNYSGSTISKAFSSGSVSGNIDVGGVAGANGASISSIYWNIESTNQNNGVGRGSAEGTTGLTTSEMTGSTAEDNMTGFDFVEIWVTTDSYPVLFWE